MLHWAQSYAFGEPVARSASDCPVEDWLAFLGHRWNACILWHLSAGSKEAGGLIDPEEVADAIVFMLTRKRSVTIRDIIILPSNFDRV